MSEGPTQDGNHPGTSKVQSLYPFGLHRGISRGWRKLGLCRGSTCRSRNLGEKQPQPNPRPGEAERGDAPISPSYSLLYRLQLSPFGPATSWKVRNPRYCSPWGPLHTPWRHREERRSSSGGGRGWAGHGENSWHDRLASDSRP